MSKSFARASPLGATYAKRKLDQYALTSNGFGDRRRAKAAAANANGPDEIIRAVRESHSPA